MQGVRDEVQDILYQLLKMCNPGTHDEKQAVLSQLQNPNPCSKPEAALNELQRFWAAARRCHTLRMQCPDVSILYTAMRSIFSAVFEGADENLRMRWICLENAHNLPQVVTFASMKKVAEFAEGELAFMALQGGKTGNPVLPLTTNQKRQEVQKK